MSQASQVTGSEYTTRRNIGGLTGGWSTRTYPQLLPENKLTVADNVCFYQDGLLSKRPGNVKYGGTGVTGSGAPIMAMTRFYYGSPKTAHLIIQSGGSLYKGNDATGAISLIGAGVSRTTPMTFAQMRDPDMTTGNAIALCICDGSRPPIFYDGTNVAGANTAAGFMPNGVVSGVTIAPRFCINWNQHMVYAGDATDPTALYISDALRPESFTGYVFTATNNTNYIPYYPGGPDGRLGDITGLAIIGTALLIFYTAGIVAGINTGAYGATQYQFQVISSTIGATSPRSIVTFETYAIFFGGDRFYATDGTTIEPFVDELPTVYSRSARSYVPPEIQNIFTVVATRHDTQYWASYDTGTGAPSRIVVCDTAANGGFVFGSLSIGEKQSGGAWSRYIGMPLGAAIECRGPTDNGQLFWGSSVSDQIYQHDVQTYSDAGTAISMEVRSKSFFFDEPINPKTVQGLYTLGVFETAGAGYTDIFQTYVYLDKGEAIGAPLSQIGVDRAGTAYGSNTYGSFVYGASFGAEQFSPKSYPASPARGLSVAVGLTETSTNPFNCIGFVLEVTIDPPED